MEQISRKSSSRGIVVWAAVLAALSLLLAIFGSPMFRVLGFEYSAISALLLSIAVGFHSAGEAARVGKVEASAILSAIKLWAIPLVISAISLPFVPNCAFGEGLKFYLLIALPAALLAFGFGSAISLMARSRRLALWLFACFWLVSFVVSLLPGYLFPQLFTYGWQYGFFPGLIWDEYVQLGSAYGWHLAEWGLLASLMLAYQWPLDRNRRAKTAAIALAYLAILLHRGENGVVTTHQKVGAALNSHLILRDAEVHFWGPSLSQEERDLLKSDIEWYMLDTRRKLLLEDTEKVSIYLYPDTESLHRLVGTRNASIAKPWLRELHIAKENLPSLRHELVHVLVREWGSFPFYASLSTALTEGIAMALEPNYDGIHTLHEHASAILRMRLADGISKIMGFTGFASGASTTSYVLAGSFTKFLLDRYSVDELAQAYSWPDIEAAYGKPLAELEREWKEEVMPLSANMDKFDSMRTEYYFKRSSIIQLPCFRHVGEMNHHARLAMRAQKYDDADSLYAMPFAETGSINAFRGRVNARLRQLAFDSARSLLHSSTFEDHPQRLALHLIKGDLLDARYYDTLIRAGLSRESVLLAFARRCLSEDDRWDAQRRLEQYYSFDSPLRQVDDGLSTNEYYTMIDTVKASTRFGQAYLAALAYREEGLLKRARASYGLAIENLKQFDPSSRLLDLLVLEAVEIGGAISFVDAPKPTGLNAEYSDVRARIRSGIASPR